MTYEELWKSELGGIEIDKDQPTLVHKNDAEFSAVVGDTAMVPPLGVYVPRYPGSMPPEGPNASYFHLPAQLCQWTPICTDIPQVALLLPAVVHHIRLFTTLCKFERTINITFTDKNLLRLALTHPSFTGPSTAYHLHVEALYNRLALIPYSSRESSQCVTSTYTISVDKTALRRLALARSALLSQRHKHNERIEFLGDAILEFICTCHLLTQLESEGEGELTLFRSSLVNNRFLAHLATSRGMHKLMLHANTTNLTQERKGRQHMLADGFESLLGAIYLDQGIKGCKKFYGDCLFSEAGEADLRAHWNCSVEDAWREAPSDRDLIGRFPALRNLTEFEERTGIVFRHISLLVRALTHSSLTNGFDFVALGSNQRLEFLGDAILQLVVSIQLFDNYPELEEGSLTLLRSALVNNQVIGELGQALGLADFVRYLPTAVGPPTKSMLADCLEAFIGALFLDKGLAAVEFFARACIFPRLKEDRRLVDWLDNKLRGSSAVAFNKRRRRK
jgi:ribonuclease-3